MIAAEILSGGAGGGLDVGVTSGSLAALHGDTIALGRNRAEAAHAHVGDRVDVMLGDGTRTRAAVVAIYTRELGFGEALLAPELAAGHQSSPLLGTILVRTAAPAAVGAAAARAGVALPRAAGRPARLGGHARPMPNARATAGSARCSSR